MSTITAPVTWLFENLIPPRHTLDYAAGSSNNLPAAIFDARHRSCATASPSKVPGWYRELRQAQGHFSRNARIAVEDARECRPRHSKCKASGRHRYIAKIIS